MTREQIKFKVNELRLVTCSYSLPCRYEARQEKKCKIKNLTKELLKKFGKKTFLLSKPPEKIYKSIIGSKSCRKKL